MVMFVFSAGQNATMAGTYAGQFVMEGMLRLRCGLGARLLATRLITVGPLLSVLLLEKETFDVVSEAVNVLQAMLLPFALAPLLVFSRSERVMGPFALRGWRLGAAAALAASMAAVNCCMALAELYAAALFLPHKLLLLVAICAYIAALGVAMSRPVKGIYCHCARTDDEGVIEGQWRFLSDSEDGSRRCSSSSSKRASSSSSNSNSSSSSRSSSGVFTGT